MCAGLVPGGSSGFYGDKIGPHESFPDDAAKDRQVQCLFFAMLLKVLHHLP